VLLQGAQEQEGGRGQRRHRDPKRQKEEEMCQQQSAEAAIAAATISNAVGYKRNFNHWRRFEQTFFSQERDQQHF
jgi:hypothetical protein